MFPISSDKHFTIGKRLDKKLNSKFMTSQCETQRITINIYLRLLTYKRNRRGTNFDP